MAGINVRVTKESLGEGEFECKKCGSTQPYKDTRKITATTLMGIIPLSTKNKDTRKCGTCGDKTELKG